MLMIKNSYFELSNVQECVSSRCSISRCGTADPRAYISQRGARLTDSRVRQSERRMYAEAPWMTNGEARNEGMCFRSPPLPPR
ncbi:hypothetical protein QQF64_020148 [Cirrhinus molitorella]|uniref:Uncharacterized protein n=1 Tax=Cirrhinus molitorella TaxID=172907 RepID=A0ABR3L8G2_9TELE